MLAFLPAELTLDILSYLHLREIPNLCLVHSSWKAVVDLHEEAIYQSVAVLHSLANRGDFSVESAKGADVLPWLDGVVGWKDFCACDPLMLLRAILRRSISRQKASRAGEGLERRRPCRAKKHRLL